MAKITVHGGPTQLITSPGSELVDLPPGAIVLPAFDGEQTREAPGTGEPGTPVNAPADGIEHELTDEGGEQPSAGSNTSPSDANTPKPPSTKQTNRRSRARTAENPSNPDPTEASTAGSTDGDTPTTGTPPTDQPE